MRLGGGDQGKRAPYLWAALAWLLDENDKKMGQIERLLNRIDALGAKGS